MTAVYLNANSGSAGQSVDSGANLLVVELSQVTLASAEGLWDPAQSAFLAPRPAVYRVSQTITYANGNGQSDGVIQGFSVNHQGPWPGTTPDLATTNVVVIQPGRFATETAQGVSALLRLNAGDTLQVALQGINSARFTLTYSSLSVSSID